MRNILAILLFVFTTVSAHAADVKISALPLGTAAATGVNDAFPYVFTATGVTKKMTIWDIANIPTIVSTYAPVANPTFTGTITAPSFVATTGMTAPYYLSASSNPATVGVIRLASTDAIEWRNNVHDANIVLGKNSSDQLTYAANAVFSNAGLLLAGAFPAMTGDVTNTAGAVATTIANSAVTNAKMANMSTAKVKGNLSGSTAAPSDVTATDAATATSVVTRDANGNSQFAALTMGHVSSGVDNVGMGGNASASALYPMLAQRDNASAINFQLANPNLGAGAGAKWQLAASNGNNGGEIGLFSAATVSPDAYSGGNMTVRSTGTTAGISYVADDSGAYHKFYVGGNGSGQKIMTVASGGLTMNSGSITGNLTGTVTGTATNATNVATTAVSTNASYFPLFAASSSNGNQAASLGTGLTFNPSTNALSTTTFVGALTGTASGNTTYTAANHGVVVSSATNAMTVITAGGGGSVLGGVASSDPAFTRTPVLGLAGTATGTLGFSGTTSGTVTIQPQAAAGTYNFNLPTTAGSSGQALLSAAGGSSPMTWGTVLTNPMTTTGDAIYSSDNSGTAARLAIGSNGKHLEAVSGIPGWIGVQSQALTGNGTVAANDDLVTCNTNTCTITLPAANAAYKSVLICKVGSDTNVTTISRAGSDTFGWSGGTSTKLFALGECIRLTPDGSSKWWTNTPYRTLNIYNQDNGSACTNTPTIANTISSTTHVGTGVCLVNWATGVWGGNPYCVPTIYGNINTHTCETTDFTNTASWQVSCQNGSGSGSTEYWTMTCTGLR